MGAFVSFYRKTSAMVAQESFDSTNKPDHTLAIHSTQIKRNIPVMGGHVAVKPQLPPSHSMSAFSDYGSKDEIFFDSQAWLHSDYEDEFMSINGEFTPSRGKTPVHHSLTPSRGYKSMDHAEPLGSTAQRSLTPTLKRKRLLDLFKESLRDNYGSSSGQFAEPPNKYEYDDNMSSKKDGSCLKREKPTGSMQGCFTCLVSVCSIVRPKKNPTQAHHLVVLKTDSMNTPKTY
ncbi:hypothetical protein R6Q57_012127 [Mikania cordata]